MVCWLTESVSAWKAPMVCQPGNGSSSSKAWRPWVLAFSSYFCSLVCQTRPHRRAAGFSAPRRSAVFSPCVTKQVSFYFLISKN